MIKQLLKLWAERINYTTLGDLNGDDIQQHIDQFLDCCFVDDGEITPSQIGSFLTFLRVTGLDMQVWVVEKCVKELRSRCVAVPMDRPVNAVDIVGTGGDGFNTFNASTAAGILVAACGIPVAKHGNRSSSSSCGSADLLEAIGCNVDGIQPEKVSDILDDCNFCFLFAQKYHPALRKVARVRKELGFCTLFNFLGPLINPINPTRIVIGVNRADLGPLFAEYLHSIGTEFTWVVHGMEGLDEISPHGETLVWQVRRDHSIAHFRVTPSSFGLKSVDLAEVKGGQPDINAQTLQRLLDNQLPVDDAVLGFVLMNAAALLFVSEKVQTLEDGVSMARKAVTSGSARATLDSFKRSCS